jgi:prepilin-type N-terminal cleavage/methylation domain-containing protein
MVKINKSGFTLIEVLTVSGIMALFSLTLIAIFLSTFRGGTKSQIIQQLHQDGDFALKSMTREIRKATTIITCDFGLTELNLLLPDNSEINYWLSDNRVASNSAFLTGGIGLVSNLTFDCLSGQLGNQIVTISFILTNEQWTQNFATSVATRQR